MKFATTLLDDSDLLLDTSRLDYFDMQTVLTSLDSDSLHVALVASFLPCAIESGFVIKGDIFIGCTGATFQLKTIDSLINKYTETTFIAVNSEEKAQHSRHSGAKLALQSLSIEKASTRDVTSAASFVSQEGHLIATPQGTSLVRWSFFSHRGEKAVRDYLEGSLNLFALCSWAPKSRPRILASARPSDRRFYNNSRRELSKLKSIALAAKLLAKGIRLPPQRNIAYLIEGIEHG